MAPKTNAPQYIKDLNSFQVDISTVEYLGNIMTYSKLNMQKYYGISNNFVLDFYADIEKKYTMRGMYRQKAPFEQAMLFSCRRGSAMFYFVDLRENSPTYMTYNIFRLAQSASSRAYLYIPRGVAYGFVTLEDNTYIDFKADNHINEKYSETFNLVDPHFNFTVPSPTAADANVLLSELLAEGKVIVSAKDKYAPWLNELVEEEELPDPEADGEKDEAAEEESEAAEVI